MLKTLFAKLKDSTVSVLPVTLLVVILNFTPLVNFSGKEIGVFLCASFVLILGMALFNLGADIAMTPMGEQIGSGLSKSGKFTALILICFVMGVFITIAEPDLTVLASQVKNILSSTALTLSIAVGVGLFLVLGILKIVFRIDLAKLMTFFYMALFAIASLVIVQGNEKFLPLAFDSGGVTTGPITVPFIMALGVGVAATLGDKRNRENSFGFVALCSIGPILAVMILGLTIDGDVNYTLPDYSIDAHLGKEFLPAVLEVAKEVCIALLPLVGFFFLLQIFTLKLRKKKIYQIIFGIFYTFFGLVLFLAAVKIGFMPIGYKMGEQLAQQNEILLVIFAFGLGLVVVLAEPAIHVLNKQVESVTGGAIRKKSMLLALSIGVGVSLALSVIRILFDFSILYYLIPGYCLSLGLSFFVPKIYTAIAFDSGGVASGPLTSSFILPFVIGVCFTIQGVDGILANAFGLVAMVAMTPLITIQALGFKAIVTKRAKEKIAMRRMLNEDDEQIIQFM
ncbi:MAG: DUF1538 domain-containing protein [Clostridia bacterium]|nr:DUF1538 domain-containing protein [Clostridia bacterium]MBQ9729154.1 DUF1538 domain-containing protein [Clostridia bacterium]